MGPHGRQAEPEEGRPDANGNIDGVQRVQLPYTSQTIANVMYCCNNRDVGHRRLSTIPKHVPDVSVCKHSSC